MPLLPAAICLASVQTASLDTFKLAGQTVVAQVPPAQAMSQEGDVSYKDWTYRFDAKGDLVGRRLGAGGGDEIKRLYGSGPSPSAVEWRTKIVLFDDVDILSKTSDGVLRERRSGYLGPDYHGALDSIALFGSMIEAYTNGMVKCVPDVQIEPESSRFEVPGPKPFNADFVRTYLRPNVNGGYYTADDNVYRGPYNSILFLHFGFTDASCQTEVNGMPVTGFSYYFSFDRERPQMLANRLFNAWIGQVLFEAGKHGYALGGLMDRPADLGTESLRLRLPQGLIPNGMWPVIANLKDTNDFGTHLLKGGSALRWSTVGEDLWAKLPLIDSQKLATEAGGVGRTLTEDVNAETPLTVVNGPSHTLLLAEPEYADFVAAQSVEPDPLCLGYITSNAGPKVVFEIGSGKPDPIKHPVRTANSTTFVGLDGTLGGYYTAKQVTDPTAGKALLVEEDWVSRVGWLTLAGPATADDTIDPGQYKLLDLNVKNVWGSHAVTVVGTAGTKTYELFAPNPQAPESTEAPAGSLNLPSDGSWHHALIDLTGVGFVKGAYLTSGNGRYWHVNLDHKPSVMIAGAALVASGQPTAATQPSPPADDIEAKSLFLASVSDADYSAKKAQILGLLKDPNQQVQLNAEGVFLHVKDHAAEDPLGELTKSLDSRVAEYAMKALMAQGTDTARGPILLALTNGPFDINRYWAAVMLADQKDPYLAENFSRLIASKNWETRMAAMHALSLIQNDKAKEFFLGFLLETVPQNQVEAASAGPLGDDTFMKRMQWYAVNDPSDAMRIQCNEDLLTTTLAGYGDEGIKGLHDESVFVRRSLLEFLAAHPDAKWHDAIVVETGDRNEEVRAAAVLALVSLPGVANSNDVASVRDDKDPRVQMALAEFSKKKSG
jgi:HEAT repeat protein